jgi:hypothetical protein
MHLQLSKLKFVGVALAMVLAPITAQAATLSYSDLVAVQKTNFNKSVTLPKFDPNLGDLNSIAFELSGLVEGSIQLESLDAAPATVTGNLGAEISLKKPDNSDLLVVLPKVTKTNQFTSTDDEADFAGTSGATYKGLKDSKVVGVNLFDGFAPFLGTGSFTLPVIATAQSGGTGAGNLLALIKTEAGANVKVVYNYTPKKIEPPRRKVPESQISLSAIALFGLGLVVTKKWNQV